MRHAAAQVTEELFPEQMTMAGTTLPLKYRFAPGHPLDGLTLTVPLPLLNQLPEARAHLARPGHDPREGPALPEGASQGLRNRLIPLPDTVTAFLETTPARTAPLPDALRSYAEARLGEPWPPDIWDGIELPAHLAVNVCVVDAGARELASGRDIAALRAQLGEAAQMSFAAGGPGFEKKGMKSWDFGDLPETLTVAGGGGKLTGYPALVDDGASVSLALLDTRDAADRETRAGVLRLLRIALKDVVGRFEKDGPGFAQAALLLKPTIPTARLLADVFAAICDRAFLGDDPLPRGERAFAEQVRRARTRLPAVAEGAFRLLSTIAAAHVALTQHLGRLPAGLRRVGAEVGAQRDALVYPGFFSATPWPRLAHLPRYLEALDRRLAKCSDNPERDRTACGAGRVALAALPGARRPGRAGRTR